MKMTLRTSVALLVISVLCLCCSETLSLDASSNTYLLRGPNYVHFSCVPSGKNVAVPIDSAESGLGYFVLDTKSAQLHYTLIHTAASIGLHSQLGIGGPGQFSKPAYVLPANESPIYGQIQLDREHRHAAELLNGRMYWTLRTLSNPDGEMRCQLSRNYLDNMAEFSGWLVDSSDIDNVEWTGEYTGVTYAILDQHTQFISVRVVHNIPSPESIELRFQGELVKNTWCNAAVCYINQKITPEIEKRLMFDELTVSIISKEASISSPLLAIEDFRPTTLVQRLRERRDYPGDWGLHRVYDLFDPHRDEQEVFIFSGNGLNTMNYTCYHCIYPFNSTMSASGIFLYDKLNATLSWIIFQNAGNQTLYNQLSIGAKGEFRAPWIILSTCVNYTSPMFGNHLPVNKTIHDRLRNGTLYYELRTIQHPDGELRGQISNNTATLLDFAGVLKHPDPVFYKYNGTAIASYNWTSMYLIVKVNHNLVAPHNISLVVMHHEYNHTTLVTGICITSKCNVTYNITRMSLQDSLIDENFVILIRNATTLIATRLFQIDKDYPIYIDTSLDATQKLTIILLAMVVLLMLIIGMIYRALRWRTWIRKGQSHLIIPKILRVAYVEAKNFKQFVKDIRDGKPIFTKEFPSTEDMTELEKIEKK